MSETTVRRRGHGEDGIYLDAARNLYMGTISLGYGPDGKRIVDLDLAQLSGCRRRQPRRRNLLSVDMADWSWVAV